LDRQNSRPPTVDSTRSGHRYDLILGVNAHYSISAYEAANGLLQPTSGRRNAVYEFR